MEAAARAQGAAEQRARELQAAQFATYGVQAASIAPLAAGTAAPAIALAPLLPALAGVMAAIMANQLVRSRVDVPKAVDVALQFYPLLAWTAGPAWDIFDQPHRTRDPWDIRQIARLLLVNAKELMTANQFDHLWALGGEARHSLRKNAKVFFYAERARHQRGRPSYSGGPVRHDLSVARAVAAAPPLPELPVNPPATRTPEGRRLPTPKLMALPAVEPLPSHGGGYVYRADYPYPDPIPPSAVPPDSRTRSLRQPGEPIRARHARRAIRRALRLSSVLRFAPRARSR